MTIAKYILTDAINNNNKFWEYEISGNTITYRWGRVGTTGQSKTEISSLPESTAQSKANSKVKKGYVKLDVVSNVVSPTTNQTSVDKQIIQNEAIKQFCPDGTDPVLMTLVNRLVETNRHEIYKSTGGKMDVDITTGIVSTPVGVVTKDTVNQARILFDKMVPFIVANKLDDQSYIENLNNYLMKIPQKVGSSKGWHKSFLANNNDIDKQLTLLDQLESSVDLALSRQKSAISNSAGNIQVPTLFNSKVTVCTDQKVIDDITKLFFSTLQQQHISSKLKPIRIYEVCIDAMNDSYNNYGAKLHNQELLWHGTRVFNILSILKNGLIIPPVRGGTYSIAGRMFGNGVYFSPSSTKSLNYSFGYWDGGPKDNNCFMFLCDVALGDYYTPKSSSETLPKSGTHSTWAKKGYSGVQNDEIIVYQTNQCNIKYLIEFGV